MTPQQVAREAKRRWGKQAYWRSSERQSSPERREQADRIFQEAKARLDAINAEIEERLKALDWYQALLAERREVREKKERHAWERTYRRCSVGKSIGIGFMVEGQGDTWEEAFADVDRKRAVSA